MPRCSIAHAVWLGVAAGCRAHSAEAYVALQQTDGAARGAALRCTSIPQPRLGWAGLGWAGLARTVGVTELPTDRQSALHCRRAPKASAPTACWCSRTARRMGWRSNRVCARPSYCEYSQRANLSNCRGRPTSVCVGSVPRKGNARSLV